MTPWKAIFREASDDTLAAIARELGLENAGGREALVKDIQCAGRATTRFLLSHLAEDELRAVSRACGLLAGGGREALVERIERRAAFETGVPRRRMARGGRRRVPRWRYAGEPFVAIDFETADRGRDSACSVALVRVEDGELVRTETRLIRPPRKVFEFTHIHGLRWADVKDAPDFGEVWTGLEELLEDAAFLAAHNAAFDRGVLEACCERAGLEFPELPWRCTVRLARATWKLRRNRLPDVCGHLGIDLDHHDATSDAQACARIVLASSEGA